MSAGKITLSAEKIEAGLGVWFTLGNQEPIAAVTELAKALKDSGDDNKQVQQALELAVEFQNQFNTVMESADKFVANGKDLIDLSEYLDKKHTIGEVQKRDTSFTQNNYDTDRIMQ